MIVEFRSFLSVSRYIENSIRDNIKLTKDAYEKGLTNFLNFKNLSYYRDYITRMESFISKKVYDEMIYNFDEIEKLCNNFNEHKNDNSFLEQVDEILDKLDERSRKIIDLTTDNLDNIVSKLMEEEKLTLEDLSEIVNLNMFLLPEHRSALQKLIDKKEKEMAEQAAMKEENGENPAEEQEEEEKSYADQMKDIIDSFENKDDYDNYMSAVIYKMLLAEGITPENTELINSALEFRRQKEQPEKDDTPEETIDLTEEAKDPVAEALAGLGVSEETIEAINNLDKNMPTVKYATGIQNLVVNDLVATINQSLSELDNKKNKNGKLSFMDNVRYSSLIQQKTQLKKGFNKTLKQKLDHIASIKQDEKISTVKNDLREAVEKNKKSTKRLESFKSAHQARKLNARLTKLKEKRAIFNGEQLATNLVAYDKKNSRLKVASNIKAFGMESAKVVGNFIGATYRFVRKTPEKFSDLKTKAGKLIKRSLTVDDEIINTAQELDNSEKSK